MSIAQRVLGSYLVHLGDMVIPLWRICALQADSEEELNYIVRAFTPLDWNDQDREFLLQCLFSQLELKRETTAA